MPIVVRYDSPALVAGAAAGAGAYTQAGIDQQRAANGYELALDADRQALGMALDIQQMNAAQRERDRAALLQGDQLRLQQYGQQLQAFGDQQQLQEGARRFDVGQANDLAMQQANLAADQQALRDRLAVQAQGQQLTANTRLATTDATNQTRLATTAMAQEGQDARTAASLEAAGVRQAEGNAAAFNRTAYTQDRIDQRSGADGALSPTQRRLQANDAHNRTVQGVRARIDMAKSSLREVDTAIASLASSFDPTRAKRPEDQARLDQLRALRGTLNADGTASGLVQQLRAAQQELADTAASSTAATPATVNSDADYDRLPSGATFIAPDGTTRRKP